MDTGIYQADGRINRTSQAQVQARYMAELSDLAFGAHGVLVQYAHLIVALVSVPAYGPPSAPFGPYPHRRGLIETTVKHAAAIVACDENGHPAGCACRDLEDDMYDSIGALSANR